MSGFLDTSVVIRYFSGAPPDLAGEAARIIDSSERLFLTGVVVAEVAYVMRSFYHVPREETIEALIGLVSRNNIATVGAGKEEVLRGLAFCLPSGRVAVADAMVWAAACSSRNRVVYSFDERFPADGVEVRRKRPEAKKEEGP